MKQAMVAEAVAHPEVGLVSSHSKACFHGTFNDTGMSQDTMLNEKVRVRNCICSVISI